MEGLLQHTCLTITMFHEILLFIEPTLNQQLPSILQELALEVMDGAIGTACDSIGMVCGNVPGSTAYQNICFGDSGGPLIQRQVRNEDGQSVYYDQLVGISSWIDNHVADENYCNNVGGFGAFVSVCNPAVRNFINGYISKEGTIYFYNRPKNLQVLVRSSGDLGDIFGKNV